jgi:phosphate-selective porin OprO/OprP
MVHGSLLQERVYYAAGLFNGDGIDGSSRGTQSDTPEAAGRLVFAPFKSTSWEWLESLQFGGSGGIANIDLANVDLEVKSTGMVGTNRNLYVLNANTKFGVLQDVDQRRRFGLEAAWAWGPVGVQGEYFYLGYTDLEPAGGPARDADFSAWYVSAIFCLTGEHPTYSKGVFEPLVPKQDFRLGGSGFGALALSVRVEHFEGDKDWITEDAFVSVRDADAFSVALSWILNPYVRVIVDYSQTDLSDPVRVRVEPDGDVDFIEEEQVVTVRLSMSL